MTGSSADTSVEVPHSAGVYAGTPTDPKKETSYANNRACDESSSPTVEEADARIEKDSTLDVDNRNEDSTSSVVSSESPFQQSHSDEEKEVVDEDVSNNNASIGNEKPNDKASTVGDANTAFENTKSGNKDNELGNENPELGDESPELDDGSNDFDDEDDEFGDFDEANNTEASLAPSFTEYTSQPVDSVTIESSATSEFDHGPKPLRVADLDQLSPDEIRSVLKPPVGFSETADDIIGDGTTPTSQQLWQHLTEPSWIPLPRWESSLIHKQLAVNLGIPQNLDTSLPRQEPRRMTLPIGAGFEEIETLQKVPDWTLLAEVSSAALERMSEDELNDHVNHLSGVLAEAMNLKEHMESREMDLMGEKNILEGMVESLLVFSQRNQRERLKQKLSK